MSERIKTGITETIIATAVDASGNPVTGKTDIKVKVWRLSDNKFLDWDDCTFKTLGSITQLLQVLTEVSALGSPGEYRYDFVTGDITNAVVDDTYEAVVIQDGGSDIANFPQYGELRVGQWVDDFAAEKYSIVQSYSYDPVLTELTGISWVEYRNVIVDDPGTVSISWYSAIGTLLFTETDVAADSQGIFKITKEITLERNKSYYAIATVTLPDDYVIQSGKGIFTVG